MARKSGLSEQQLAAAASLAGGKKKQGWDLNRLLIWGFIALVAWAYVRGGDEEAAGGSGGVSGVPYAEEFNATADLGIDPRLVAAMAKIESWHFDQDVIECREDSPAGARGIMQFMPATAAERGIDPCNPRQAIRGAAEWLVALKGQFGSWDLAVAAYNAGPGAVANAGGIPVNGETEVYVPRVMDQWEAYKREFPNQRISTAGPDDEDAPEEAGECAEWSWDCGG